MKGAGTRQGRQETKQMGTQYLHLPMKKEPREGFTPGSTASQWQRWGWWPGRGVRATDRGPSQGSKIMGGAQQ